MSQVLVATITLWCNYQLCHCSLKQPWQYATDGCGCVPWNLWTRKLLHRKIWISDDFLGPKLLFLFWFPSPTPTIWKGINRSLFVQLSYTKTGGGLECSAGHSLDSGALLKLLRLHVLPFGSSFTLLILLQQLFHSHLLHWVLPQILSRSPSQVASYWLCPLLAGGPWANYLTPLSLRFHTCEMEIILVCPVLR